MGAAETKNLSSEETESLKKKTAFSGKEIRDLYDKFHADYPSGEISKSQFIDMYKQMFPATDVTQFAENVFRAYDTDGNGAVDFHEFLVTLSVASKGNIDEKLEWAFNMYDLDGNGQVSRQEAVEIITAIYKMKGEGHQSREKAQDATEQLFVFLDKDHDDQLSRKEFVQAAKGSSAILGLLSGSA